MGVDQRLFSLLVSYDDYDSLGLLLDIRHGTLYEISLSDTRLLSSVLRFRTLTEALQELGNQDGVLTLLEWLRNHHLLDEPLATLCPSGLPSENTQPPQGEKWSLDQPVTWKQRFIGAGHLLTVLNELRQGDVGLYKAYQYLVFHLHPLSNSLLTPERAFQRVREEYWFYRLVLGPAEKRVAHLLGQVAANEGLCMIRAFALSSYLIGLHIPSQIVIGRPKYGSSDGFKLHSWVEMEGKPLNERPNIRDAYRIMEIFPSF